MAKKKSAVHVGSGNVFADIGVNDPDEMVVKAELAARITEILRERSLNQTEAAEILGIDQPKISLLFRGRLRDFSLERLMRFLTSLHRNIRIVVDQTPRRRKGKLTVEAT